MTLLLPELRLSIYTYIRAADSKGKDLTLPFRSLAELTLMGRSKQRPDRCMPQLLAAGQSPVIGLVIDS